MSANNDLQSSIPLDPREPAPATLQVDTPFGPAPVDGQVLLANVTRFGRLLRRAGMDVDSGQTATFARALTLLGLDRRADVRAAGRARRSRAARSGHRHAARAMLRRAMSTGGEALRWHWLRRTDRPRPIVLVCDISGSMERYSRFMLRFAHALQRSGAPLEVFVFGTRLTRITRQLRIRSADAALRRVAE